jgi:XTP/dITP diphosphohydrolase
MNTREQKLEAFGRLLDIMDDLRTGCPWDRKQTLESLRHLSIEEVYELGDAILKNDMDEIKKELGDILLHIVFYSKIASETESFDIADVANSISEKLIFRHPHIYSDVKVDDEEDVKKNWEALKLKEGRKSVLEGVPASLPALIKASRIQDKAKGVGFDWSNSKDVWNKFKEEEREFLEALQLQDKTKMEEEFGDMIFSLVNFARFVKINPEDALERTNLKFIKRFSFIEGMAKANGMEIQDLTLEQMENYWNQAKKH